MAEGRMLKRVISTSPRLAALKNDTHRLIYTWMIPFLDVEGRIEADSRILKGCIAPLLDHITTRIMDAALRDMADNDLIVLYSAGGNKYLQLQRFSKHQNIRRDKERGSNIPEPRPDNSRTTPGQLPEEAGLTPPQEKRREDNTCASFGTFWNRYPKKKSKGQAEKVWIKIKPDEQLLVTMIAKIEQAMKSEDWIKKDGQFIPYPATWLNAKGWKDEISTNGNNGQKSQKRMLKPSDVPDPDHEWDEICKQKALDTPPDDDINPDDVPFD
jgi:hypothetical protein